MQLKAVETVLRQAELMAGGAGSRLVFVGNKMIGNQILLLHLKILYRNLNRFQLLCLNISFL
jgi:hypothetical protein